MGMVFGLHEFVARPGVSVAELEQLLLDTGRYFREATGDGWSIHLLKADRGARKGQLALLHVFDSVEVRDRYFPVEGGEASEAAQRVFAGFPSELEGRWDRLVDESLNTYTDFVSFS